MTQVLDVVIGGDRAAFYAAVSFLLAVFCLGGMAGLAVAWSQEERMRKWAGGVAKAMALINELEEKGDVDRARSVRRRLGLDPDEDPPAEHARGARPDAAPVHVGAAQEVVHQQQPAQAVRKEESW